VTPTYVQDVNNQTLKPYVMLMLTYQLGGAPAGPGDAAAAGRSRP
jgi:hypothetical protein